MNPSSAGGEVGDKGVTSGGDGTCGMCGACGGAPPWAPEELAGLDAVTRERVLADVQEKVVRFREKGAGKRGATGAVALAEPGAAEQRVDTERGGVRDGSFDSADGGGWAEGEANWEVVEENREESDAIGSDAAGTQADVSAAGIPVDVNGEAKAPMDGSSGNESDSSSGFQTPGGSPSSSHPSGSYEDTGEESREKRTGGSEEGFRRKQSLSVAFEDRGVEETGLAHLHSSDRADSELRKHNDSKPSRARAIPEPLGLGPRALTDAEVDRQGKFSDVDEDEIDGLEESVSTRRLRHSRRSGASSAISMPFTETDEDDMASSGVGDKDTASGVGSNMGDASSGTDATSPRHEVSLESPQLRSSRGFLSSYSYGGCEGCDALRKRVAELETHTEALESALEARAMASVALRAKVGSGMTPKAQSNARLREEVDSLRMTVDFLFRKIEKYEGGNRRPVADEH